MASPPDDCLTQRVEAALRATVDIQRDRLATMSPQLVDVADALADFVLDGGKRLRPAFAYWGCRGAGGPDSDALVRAVASLEWLQAGALIHDDLMDASDTRRGAPSMHRRLEAMHAARGWRSDAADFGRSAATVLGDLCLIWADESLHRSGIPGEALLATRPAYDEMRTEVMAGQYLDLLAQAIGEQTSEQAMLVARFKTAKYTVERPLHLGAAIAGAPAAMVESYSAYGLPLGEAFQLRDDVLGVFGDPARTGKPAGDDLREGKRTVLVAETLERASAADAAMVQRCLGDPGLDHDGVQALREVIERTGALAHVERLIDQLTAQARVALEQTPVTDQARDVLAALVTAATVRTG